MVKICSQNISETSRCGLARPIKVDFKIGGLHSFEWLSRSSNKSLNTYTSGEFEGQVYTTNTLLFFLNHSWTFIPYLYIRANNPAEKGLSVVTSSWAEAEHGALAGMPSSHPLAFCQVFPASPNNPLAQATFFLCFVSSSTAHEPTVGLFSDVLQHGHPDCSPVMLTHVWRLSIIRISVTHLTT